MESGGGAVGDFKAGIVLTLDELGGVEGYLTIESFCFFTGVINPLLVFTEEGGGVKPLMRLFPAAAADLGVLGLFSEPG
ncbi:hypothetical protein WICPIJ_007760 [Wickerhamomyces pijperi]|uniref:Uncharacterized protein n=1 Tax=Wickerhamomyces pijperi TaxID=599730 RepID=A0A9P8Q1T6_WICPI|nr:hypothetical protein WICPIJ_007760 [Wickerhamomyces pijperi]